MVQDDPYPIYCDLEKLVKLANELTYFLTITF